MSSKSELLQFRDSTVDETADVDLTDDIKGVKVKSKEKSILGIYEFTNLLLERKGFEATGKIKYLCCSKPWKINFKEKKNPESDAYKVIPFQAVYTIGKTDTCIKYKELQELMKDVIFTITTTKFRKLSEKALKNGFILDVRLLKEDFGGHSYYRYYVGDDMNEKIVSTLSKFIDNNWEFLNEKYNPKPKVTDTGFSADEEDDDIVLTGN
jgi:hypothetical protein